MTDLISQEEADAAMQELVQGHEYINGTKEKWPVVEGESDDGE